MYFTNRMTTSCSLEISSINVSVVNSWYGLKSIVITIEGHIRTHTRTLEKETIQISWLYYCLRAHGHLNNDTESNCTCVPLYTVWLLMTTLKMRPYLPKYSFFLSVSGSANRGERPTTNTRFFCITLHVCACVCMCVCVCVCGWVGVHVEKGDKYTQAQTHVGLNHSNALELIHTY